MQRKVDQYKWHQIIYVVFAPKHLLYGYLTKQLPSERAVLLGLSRTIAVVLYNIQRFLLHDKRKDGRVITFELQVKRATVSSLTIKIETTKLKNLSPFFPKLIPTK